MTDTIETSEANEMNLVDRVYWSTRAAISDLDGTINRIRNAISEGLVESEVRLGPTLLTRASNMVVRQTGVMDGPPQEPAGTTPPSQPQQFLGECGWSCRAVREAAYPPSRGEKEEGPFHR